MQKTASLVIVTRRLSQGAKGNVLPVEAWSLWAFQVPTGVGGYDCIVFYSPQVTPQVGASETEASGSAHLVLLAHLGTVLCWVEYAA